MGWTVVRRLRYRMGICSLEQAPIQGEGNEHVQHEVTHQVERDDPDHDPPAALTDELAPPQLPPLGTEVTNVRSELHAFGFSMVGERRNLPGIRGTSGRKRE